MLKQRSVCLTGHLHAHSAVAHGRYSQGAKPLGQPTTSLGDKHRGFRSSNTALCLPRASSYQENAIEQTSIKTEK